nr:MAG TPA: DNA-directed RNA polymerase [Caudoviricetes sp.]
MDLNHIDSSTPRAMSCVAPPCGVCGLKYRIDITEFTMAVSHTR